MNAMEWSSISHASKQFKYLIAQHMIRKTLLKGSLALALENCPFLVPIKSQLN